MRPPGHLHIDQIRLAPSQEWSDESSAWRFVLLREGAAYWLDPAKPRSMAIGEVLVLAPLIRGVIRASQLTEVCLEGFNFDLTLLGGFFTAVERHILENQEQRIVEPVRFLPSTHPVSQGMMTLANQRPFEHELLTRVEVLGLALRVIGEALPQQGPSGIGGSAAQDRFQEVISRMPDMELIAHTSEDLARLCGCTPRHFNRLFRAHFGQSPRARQTELRLLKARQLLDSSEEKVIEIAAACGYRSLSLFNSLFKRRFGMSPTDWRNRRVRHNGFASVLLWQPLLSWGIGLVMVLHSITRPI